MPRYGRTWVPHHHHVASTRSYWNGCTKVVENYCSCGQFMSSSSAVHHQPQAAYDAYGNYYVVCAQCGTTLG